MYSSIWPIDGTLTGTINRSQSGPGSNGNQGVLNYPLSSRAETSPSDCFMSYPGHSLEVSYIYGERQLMHSAAPANDILLKIDFQK